MSRSPSPSLARGRKFLISILHSLSLGGKEIGYWNRGGRERVANQNIDGLWLFALIVILTGGKPAAEAGER